MKKIENIKKPNFIKKIFIKFCRFAGFEIIDQSNLYLPVSKKLANENLSSLGNKNITVPLGETKITRAVKSLDIIIKTCTSVNLVTQNKKRIFERDKSEYTFRSINSILNSLNLNKEELKKIKIKIFIVDFDSKNEDLKNIQNKLENSNFEFEIINLNLENYYIAKFTPIKDIT